MNQTSPLTSAPLEASISAVFYRVAARFPSRIALVCNGHETSYRELAGKARQIAATLRQRGVEPGSLVGLCAQRTPETIAAILGILDAGAAYVPFDPSFPPRLLQSLYQDSAPALMLVQASLFTVDAHPHFWAGEALDIGAVLDAPGISTEAHTQRPMAPDALAYVMYTSGSTGRPKGVMVPQRGVLRLVMGSTYAHFGPDEVLLQLAPLSFDASTFEIWGALLHGGCLAILPTLHPSLDEIAEAIERYRVTTMWLTAGLFHLMVDHRLDGLQPLRQLLVGGDVLSREHVDKALRNLPNCRLINGYGPTENTTFTCCYEIPRGDGASGPIPIGAPIEQTEVFVLDEELRRVKDGDEGELYVGGAGVACGYLKRPELTAERFIPNPFATTTTAINACLYRTGDRGRKRADGNYEFLGRIDRQVKIDGKRVELDEIESCLRRSGCVGNAAVICIDAENGARRIAAFVTPQVTPQIGQHLSEEELRTFLRHELPDYMQPSAITVLEALPLSPTGKVDRAQLQHLLAPAASAADLQAPANAIEAELLRIWRQVLGRPTIGPEDNFFDLGGSSLQLMKIHALIQESLQCSVAITDLFTHPKISVIAAHIQRAKEDMVASETRSAMDRARLLLPPLAPQTHIARPVSVQEYFHASIGTSRYTLEDPSEVVFVLRGQSTLTPPQWQAALDRVVAVNPGACLRMRGILSGTCWRSDGLPPRLRMLEHCDWDTQTERGAEFIRETPLTLDNGPTLELIVAAQPDGGALVILRALHAVMDGGGAMHFLHELFRALRGEMLLGSNVSYSDADLMRSVGETRATNLLSKTARLTGQPQGQAMGDEFRRIALGPARPHLLARVASAMAEFAHQYSNLPARIAIPVDLRLLEPHLLATTNFCFMLYVSLDKGQGSQEFMHQLQRLMAESVEAGFPRLSDSLKLLPMPWLDWLVSRTPLNYCSRNPTETALISNLGCQASADLCCPGFQLRDMVVLPPPGNAFATLVGIDHQVEMMLNLPRILSSNGRFDALVAHLQQRLRD